MDKNDKYLLGFSLIEGMDFTSFSKIWNFFKGNLEEAWGASISDFLRAGLKELLSQKIVEKNKEIDLEEEWKIKERLNIDILNFYDDQFPQLLKQIKNPPFVLFIRGKIPPDDSLMIAIVGTRKASLYGKKIARSLAFDLGKQGIVVVSGLAYGIDTEAHLGAIEAGGITLAVMGCGLDYIYPPANKRLADAIIQNNGALISEYPFKTPPNSWNFPQRNRIIAGLCLGTVVVEAPFKSGALITAQIAGNEGREVFGVPGSIDQKNSSGPNYLIKKGAKLISNFKDILSEFNIEIEEEKKEIKPESKEEKTILDILKERSLTTEEIIQEMKVSPAQLSSLLMMMEVEGKIKNIEGKYTL